MINVRMIYKSSWQGSCKFLQIIWELKDEDEDIAFIAGLFWVISSAFVKGGVYTKSVCREVWMVKSIQWKLILQTQLASLQLE